MGYSRYSFSIVAAAVGFISICSFLHAQPAKINLTAVKKEYPEWYQVFKNDFDIFSKRIENAKEKVPSKEVDSIFENSVEANSKMTLLLDAFQTHGGMLRAPQGIEPGFTPLAYILLDLLKDAKPVRLGGEEPISKGTVVYINLEKILKDLRNYGPYYRKQLGFQKTPPKDGKLHRGYPFLVFKRVHGRLVLSSISKELWTIVEAIHTLQIT